MTTRDSDTGFLSRWSRRKVQARQRVAPEEPATPSPSDAALPQAPVAAAPAALPTQSVDERAPPAGAPQPAPPTLADVAQLTRESDYGRFVAPDVDGEVKNAALKKLFTDPHFNAMDGLDVYIDDYNKPDPLPKSMLRQMAQAAFLGLLDDEPPAGPSAAAAQHAAPAADAPAAATGVPADAPVSDAAATPHGATPDTDEDADLRLQPHDAAGCGGAASGAAADRDAA